MANPNIELYIASDAKLPDIGRLLGIDASRVSPRDTINSFKFDETVGHIIVTYKHSPMADFGRYNATWTLVLEFDSGFFWDSVKIALVISLYEWLSSEYPGTYLAAYDTGRILFYSHQGNLLINKSEKTRLANLCFPAGCAFEELSLS